MALHASKTAPRLPSINIFQPPAAQASRNEALPMACATYLVSDPMPALLLCAALHTTNGKGVGRWLKGGEAGPRNQSAPGLCTRLKHRLFVLDQEETCQGE